MIARDFRVTNDFDIPLFVLYEDRHRHVMKVMPNQAMNLSYLIGSRIADLHLLKFWLYDFGNSNFHYIKLPDINFTASYIDKR